MRRMDRKSVFIIVLLVVGLSCVSRASAELQRPKLWAALSVNRSLFHEGGTKGLSIHFTLVNDGEEIVAPNIESSKITINGAELEDSRLILGNGPRDDRWNALPSGKAIEFAYALEDYFKKPGIYRVSWKGENFETPTIEFRVMPDKTNP